jgi:hypothetical protein
MNNLTITYQKQGGRLRQVQELEEKVLEVRGVGVRPRSHSLEPLAPALPLLVPGLGLGWVLVLILA